MSSQWEPANVSILSAINSLDNFFIGFAAGMGVPEVCANNRSGLCFCIVAVKLSILRSHQYGISISVIPKKILRKG